MLSHCACPHPPSPSSITHWVSPHALGGSFSTDPLQDPALCMADLVEGVDLKSATSIRPVRPPALTAMGKKQINQQTEADARELHPTTPDTEKADEIEKTETQTTAATPQPRSPAGAEGHPRDTEQRAQVNRTCSSISCLADSCGAERLSEESRQEAQEALRPSLPLQYAKGPRAITRKETGIRRAEDSTRKSVERA